MASRQDQGSLRGNRIEKRKRGFRETPSEERPVAGGASIAPDGAATSREGLPLLGKETSCEIEIAFVKA